MGDNSSGRDQVLITRTTRATSSSNYQRAICCYSTVGSVDLLSTELAASANYESSEQLQRAYHKVAALILHSALMLFEL
jgi:hypothetical protein